MKMLYIKEKEENSNLKQKIKNYFNVIEITYNDKKIFFTLPIDNNSKEKKIIKVAKKLNKLLYNDCIKNVVLSTNLLKNNLLKNKLYEENINILDGRKLFLLLAKQAIEKACDFAKTNMNQMEISILVNDNSEINIATIIEIAKNSKRLNIITNHIERFERLQNYLYNDLGIMIKVSNNKKKDLINSKIILNIDFVEEIINEYKLPYKGIILNINNEITLNTKQFNGININYYNIIMKDIYKIPKFNDEIVYESLIYKASLEDANKRILKDRIRNKDVLRKEQSN